MIFFSLAIWDGRNRLKEVKIGEKGESFKNKEGKKGVLRMTTRILPPLLINWKGRMMHQKL